MAGLFVQDVNSRQDHGTAQTAVDDIWVCGNCAVALHPAQEARHEARALRKAVHREFISQRDFAEAATIGSACPSVCAIVIPVNSAKVGPISAGVTASAFFPASIPPPIRIIGTR